MKTVICLPMPPSTNNLFSGGVQGRRFISPQYKAWRESAAVEIMRQRPKAIPGQVVLSFAFQEPKRRSDIDNRLKGPIDLLVFHGLIEADDDSIVREVRAKWSADVEGMRVTIQDLASTIFKDEQAA